MKLNKINPDTYDIDDADLVSLKKMLVEMLVEMGVVVHCDMMGPTDQVEIFVDGLGKKEVITAKIHGVVYDDTPIEDIAKAIASNYKHFAWYMADTIQHREMLTGKQLLAYSLRFAGW